MAELTLQERAREQVAARPGEGGLYDKDFWSWTQQQAAALRDRNLDAVDWDNLIEEVATLGRSEEKAWRSLCRNTISHLLKIEHGGRARDIGHWRDEINEWRKQMHECLLDNPGMKGELGKLLGRAWAGGREDAVEGLAAEGGKKPHKALRQLERAWGGRLPEERPYALADIVGYDVFADGASPDKKTWPAAVARRMNEELGEDYPVVRRPPGRGPERGGGFSR